MDRSTDSGSHRPRRAAAQKALERVKIEAADTEDYNQSRGSWRTEQSFASYGPLTGAQATSSKMRETVTESIESRIRAPPVTSHKPPSPARRRSNARTAGSDFSPRRGKPRARASTTRSRRQYKPAEGHAKAATAEEVKEMKGIFRRDPTWRAYKVIQDSPSQYRQNALPAPTVAQVATGTALTDYAPPTSTAQIADSSIVVKAPEFRTDRNPRAEPTNTITSTSAAGASDPTGSTLAPETAAKSTNDHPPNVSKEEDKTASTDPAAATTTAGDATSTVDAVVPTTGAASINAVDDDYWDYVPSEPEPSPTPPAPAMREMDENAQAILRLLYDGAGQSSSLNMEEQGQTDRYTSDHSSSEDADGSRDSAYFDSE